MKKRKTIAVVIGSSEQVYRNRCLTGIIRQAKLLDYNIAFFSLFTFSKYRTKHQLGEENIYELLRIGDIAGVIIIDYTFWESSVKKSVYDFISSSLPETPIVILDANSDYGFINVTANDKAGIAIVVDHLIENHGCRKIYCLTGNETNPLSQVRLNGYLESMKQHGLEVTADCIFYGDFWVQAAKKLAENIACGEVGKPDAVICCNDMSAVTLVNELIGHGISVPGDILVAGYDLDVYSMTNDPTVTSATRPDLYSGERCVCELHKAITGGEISPNDIDTSIFVSGESCGCHRNVSFAYKFHEAERREKISVGQFRLSSMQESLMAAGTYDELFAIIISDMYLIRDCAALVICLNREWNEFSDDDSVYLRKGYSDNMFEALTWTKRIEKRNIPYDIHESIFPPDILLDDRPVACFFNSMHFEDRCLGYQVVRFENDEESMPEGIYHAWVSGVCLALEYMRMRARMNLMYNRAFSNSIRDGMTGLYNRLGFEMYSADVFRSAKTRGVKILVIAADLDNLKTINDNYGHDEGDNAIMVAARALQTCCSNGEYCVRTGGDEFIVFGAYEYDNAIPLFYRSRIDGYLSRYNSSSEKPYNVGISTGFFLDFTDGYENIDQCLKIADERMYENKLERKKGR